MMNMRRCFQRFLVSGPGVLLLAGAAAHAQVPGAAGSPGGVNAALTLLFGTTTAFTAHAEIQMLDPSQKETLRMPMNFAELDGKTRVEIDVAQIQSRNLPAQQVSQMKEAGLARIVSVIRQDKKASYILYPAMQSYAIIPMPKEESDVLAGNLKIEKTPLGNETIDGHPCVKNRVTIRNGKNTVLEAATWNAANLKDFPVQIETKDKGSSSILRFRQVRFVRPDPKLFEIPAGYKQLL